ncbi:MAG: galactokinase [Planctomycetes bacterium]|nr:galactokinase [Planctomycetota bacterium]
MSERVEKVLASFAERYGDATGVTVVRAPGRVNIIGEHTDYNGGFVMPIAIERDIMIACRPNGSMQVDLYSVDFGESNGFSLDNIRFNQSCQWVNYPQGVAHCLLEKGFDLKGFDGVVQGNVPLASGLSSSAACEVASALAFKAMSGFDIGDTDLALLCQRAENTFVGVNCGIMDQYVSVFAQPGCAVFLDCKDLRHEDVPLGTKEATFVVCNTMVKRELSGSEYNTRRQQCEEAAKAMDAALLRDVSPETFEAECGKLPEDVRKRARHVISEDERTLRAVAAFKAGDLAAAGKEMNDSHDSLRDDYEVSCRELDIMVDIARGLPGTYGARMTGAGFGGCTVNLVAADKADAFCAEIAKRYKAETGLNPMVLSTEPCGGAGRVETR